MTTYEATISKIQDLSEPLAEELNDFIEFLQIKCDNSVWQSWTLFREVLEIAESDMGNYLRNLSDYEDKLARGAIRW